MDHGKEPLSTQAETSDESSMTTIREGKAEICVPKTGTSKVFYNPVQEFNRDLSSAVLKIYVDNISKWKRKQSTKQAVRQDKVEGYAETNEPESSSKETSKS